MEITVNLLLDKITSIDHHELTKHPDLILLRDALVKMKMAEDFKGYGGMHKLEIENSTYEKIAGLTLKKS